MVLYWVDMMGMGKGMVGWGEGWFFCLCV